MAVSQSPNKDIPIEVLFKCLYHDYRQLRVRLGMEKAYSDELENKIRNLEDGARKHVTVADKETVRQIKSEEMYRQLRKLLQVRKAALKSAYAARDNALSQVAALTKQLEPWHDNSAEVPGIGSMCLLRLQRNNEVEYSSATYGPFGWYQDYIENLLKDGFRITHWKRFGTLEDNR